MQRIWGAIGIMVQFKESPASEIVPSDWQNKIVHMDIAIAIAIAIDEIELAGADVLPERYQKPTGFYLLLGVSAGSSVHSIFKSLSVGGGNSIFLSKNILVTMLCNYCRSVWGAMENRLWHITNFSI